VGQEPSRGARKVHMPKPPPSESRISMSISQTTGAQHIPAPKANRGFPVPFASCAIFWYAPILLNTSTAEEIPKSQRSNAPSVAGWALNGGSPPPNMRTMNERWRNTSLRRVNPRETNTSRAMKAGAAPTPSANASEFFPLRNKRKSSARLSNPQRPNMIGATIES